MRIDREFLEQYLPPQMKRNLDEKRAAGAIVRVLHGEETCYEHACGAVHPHAQEPVTAQTIFRLYSMTKLVTMTALLQLYERGLVFPEDRLEDFLPEFRDMPVAVDHEDGSVTYEKQASPITIKQLCTMCSGLSYPGEGCEGERSVRKQYARLASKQMPLRDAAHLLATECALCFQPGSHWKYGYSHDVVGAVIEVVAGQSFGAYLRQNILDPLDMKDTGFCVSAGQRPRFVSACTEENGDYHAFDDEPELTLSFLDACPFESGGGGLVSTMDDYARFTSALLCGGSAHGVRLLGPKTLAMMTANQLSDAQLQDFNWRERGYGYGYGVRTALRPSILGNSVGEFGWDGMMGSWVSIDPAENLAVVYLQNHYPYNHDGIRLMPTIYAALRG